VNSLPVLDEKGRAAGIISRSDVLKAFIEVLGIGEISSRLEVVVPDRPGGLAQVIAIIKSFNVNIASVLTTGHAEEGKRAIFFRVATLNVAPLKKAIQEAGYEILDPSSFHL
jgi:acetoin utilization protein AcuB